MAGAEGAGEVGRDAGLSRARLPVIEGRSDLSPADGVGLGVAVAEDHEEVDEVGLLGGRQTEIAHLAVLSRSRRWSPWRPPGRG